MADQDPLKATCSRLANIIGEAYPAFAGFEVRADAGDAGMIYVALRGARGEVDTGRTLAEKLESLVESELAEDPGDFDFAISVGRGDQDLLLQIEVRPT